MGRREWISCASLGAYGLVSKGGVDPVRASRVGAQAGSAREISPPVETQ